MEEPLRIGAKHPVVIWTQSQSLDLESADVAQVRMNYLHLVSPSPTMTRIAAGTGHEFQVGCCLVLGALRPGGGGILRV